MDKYKASGLLYGSIEREKTRKGAVKRIENFYNISQIQRAKNPNEEPQEGRA